jgi:hypothetical protein
MRVPAVTRSQPGRGAMQGDRPRSEVVSTGTVEEPKMTPVLGNLRARTIHYEQVS